MNTLLKAIQAALIAASSLDYLKGSVHIVPEGPDHDVLPDETNLPAVGITDGSEGIRHETQRQKSVTRIVRVTAYVEIMRPERSIVGDDVMKGVIDILSDVQVLLDYNLLKLAGYSQAKSLSMEASTAIPLGENLWGAKKTLIFEYRFHG